MGLYNRGMDYNNPNFPLSGYSFDRENVALSQKERPTALALREAFEDLQAARQAYEKAYENIPNYTGQWNNSDYVRDEEQTMIAASHAFEDALVASVLARSQG